VADTRDSKVVGILKRLGRPPEERLKISGVLKGQEELAGFKVSGIMDGGEVSERLFRELGENGLNIRLIVHHTGRRGESNLLICVEREKLEDARNVVAPIVYEAAGAHLEVHASIHVVSIYPHREDPAIAGVALAALAAADIECLAVSAAGSVISFAVDGRNLEAAAKILEDAFLVG
jgi:aspartokinase